MHAYNTDNGEVRYTIDLDEAKFGLEKKPGYLTVEMDGRWVKTSIAIWKAPKNKTLKCKIFVCRFVVAADHSRVVIWDSLSGKYDDEYDDEYDNALWAD